MLVGTAQRWCVTARYHCYGAVPGRRTQGSEQLTQDLVGAHCSYLSGAGAFLTNVSETERYVYAGHKSLEAL